MNLCEATQNELCLLLDQETPPSDLRDHLAKCPSCRAFAAKLRHQDKQLNAMAYPDSPNWAALVRGKGDVNPAPSPNLARKERTLGKIAVAFALAASLLMAVAGLLTQFNKNSTDSQVADSKRAAGEPAPPPAPREAGSTIAPATNAPNADANLFSLDPENANFGGGGFGASSRLAESQAGGTESKVDSKPMPAVVQKDTKIGAALAPLASRTMAKAPGVPDPNPTISNSGPDAGLDNMKRDLAPAPGLSRFANSPKPVLVPERVKILKNLLDDQKTLAVALAKGDMPKLKTPVGSAKAEGLGIKPKHEAIVKDYEHLIGSNLPNLLTTLSNLPPQQRSVELEPLLVHLRTSESEYSRLAVQYPSDGEWLRQIALLARVGILQIRTAQKDN